MAGSYNHATTGKGKLRSPKSMIGLVENGGDAYETIEEMYGMIWYLADRIAMYQQDRGDMMGPDEWKAAQAEEVEDARKAYKKGIALSPGVQK